MSLLKKAHILVYVKVKADWKGLDYEFTSTKDFKLVEKEIWLICHETH